MWAALLTPQGKWLADFFVLADGERLLLDCDRAPTPPCSSPACPLPAARPGSALRDASGEMAVHAAWDGAPDVPPGTIAAPDPRLPEAGWRILADTAACHQRHLRRTGTPTASASACPTARATWRPRRPCCWRPGSTNCNGVSWTKGCYMGQELTARTKYRGLVKRRLVPVAIDGPLPAPGTPITHAGQEVGTMRSGQNHTGLALLRLDALTQTQLTCGPTQITPNPPTWMRTPATA